MNGAIAALDRAAALVALAESQKTRTRATIGPVDHGRTADMRAQRERLRRGGGLFPRKAQWSPLDGTLKTVVVMPAAHVCPLCGADVLREVVHASTWACGECEAIVFAHELELCSGEVEGKGDE